MKFKETYGIIFLTYGILFLSAVFQEKSPIPDPLDDGTIFVTVLSKSDAEVTTPNAIRVNVVMMK